MKPTKLSAILILMLLFSVAFTACGGSNSPDGAVISFFKAIEKGDVDGFLSHLPPEMTAMSKEFYDSEAAFKRDMGQMLSEMNRGMEQDLGSNWSRNISATTIEEDGDWARVEVTITIDGQTETDRIEMVKTDGKWRILDFWF